MKDKLTGKAEELKGKLTGDEGEELKGKARQGVGDVKQTGKELAYDAEHPEDSEDIDRDDTTDDRGPDRP
ncbi:MAG TPA: CsbD family protein [Candidatus Dormibacteraeota bacterium]|nr:CsbD family protein [Candidatus Dormibacteraeota bacterium]